MAFTARILCSRCGRVVRVGGRIWGFRLRWSKLNEKGQHIGWNCDHCADAIECGADY